MQSLPLKGKLWEGDLVQAIYGPAHVKNRELELGTHGQNVFHSTKVLYPSCSL